MNVKNIIFTISALIVFGVGVLLYDYFQKRIYDSTWLITILKIVILLVLFVVYCVIYKWAAGLFHIGIELDAY